LKHKSADVFEKVCKNNADIGREVAAEPQINRLQDALRSRNFDDVIQIYNSLPADLKNIRSILLLRLNASTWLKQVDWEAAIKDFEKCFPADPQIDLCRIDIFIREKKVDEAFKAI